MVCVVHLLTKGKSLCSPDGRLNFELRDNQPGGELFYEINYKGVPVIRSSLLRISNREANMEIERVLERLVDSVWFQVYGERANVMDRYNEKIIVVKKPNRRDSLQIIVGA